MRLPLRLSTRRVIPISYHELLGVCSTRNFAAAAYNSQKNRDSHRANASSGEGPDDRHADRDLFLSVLSASTTRRDAKSYLSRFKPRTIRNTDATEDPNISLSDPIHVALVKIRAPQTLEDGIISGVAQTLSLLKQLGLTSIVVVDCAVSDNDSGPTPALRATAMAQSHRLVSTIQKSNGVRARLLDYVLGVEPEAPQPMSAVPVFGSVGVQQDDILYRTVAAGTIPVIPPIAYTTDIQTVKDVQPDEVMLALTRQFVGPQWTGAELEPTLPPQKAVTSRDGINVDRIIVLDPLGGLPSATRPDKAHIFVNLEQEYRDIQHELRTSDVEQLQAEFGKPNVMYSEVSGVDGQRKHLSEDQVQVPSANERHVRNLSLLQRSLSLLPSSSSALLTSPAEAATFHPAQTSSAADLGVGTRRPRNPLIFNLLTDKPLISSSLPVSRLQAPGGRSYVQTGQATFVKRGMSLTMIPDPRQETWAPPRSDHDGLSLEDPRIDFGRLLNLIEDSFNRPLDVKHFLKRIRNRIAGVIVAGEYEGGALLTWELPPGVPDDGSEESRQRMVPYLDKFAVLKRSQGGGGVADIVFSAMVRSCFPEGVCWRSRKNNPVNKWYFERSVGTLKLPESTWSMFWTTDGLFEDRQKLLDYEGVCRSVQPSWADQKQAD